MPDDLVDGVREAAFVVARGGAPAVLLQRLSGSTALPITTGRPANASISRSFRLSPTAMTAARSSARRCVHAFSAAPLDQPPAMRSSSEKSRSAYSVSVMVTSEACGRRLTSSASTRILSTLPVNATWAGSSVSAASIGSTRVMNARFRS